MSNDLVKRFEELGHEDGMRDGIKSGGLEGRVLGCEKGFEIACQVGYYSGFAETWIKLVEAHPEKFSPR
jgi:hypothetical protein